MSSSASPQRSVPDAVAAPLYTRPTYLLLVLAGGAVGTTVRYGLEKQFGADAGQWPWTTFGINVTGSFLLGLLLTLLSRTGTDEGWRRRARLTAGTGVMGGFTTYSTFIVEIDQLVRAGEPVRGVAYALASVALGIAAALCGVLVGRSVTRSGAAR